MAAVCAGSASVSQNPGERWGGSAWLRGGSPPGRGLPAHPASSERRHLRDPETRRTARSRRSGEGTRAPALRQALPGLAQAGPGTRVPCPAKTRRTHRTPAGQDAPSARRPPPAPAAGPAPLPAAAAEPPFSSAARGRGCGRSPPPKGIPAEQRGFRTSPAPPWGSSESHLAVTPPPTPTRVPGMCPHTKGSNPANSAG